MNKRFLNLLKWPVLSVTRLFDAEFYKRHYPDAMRYPGGVRLHYIRHGCEGGRRPNEFFDPEFYLEMYPDVDGRCPAFLHYILFGRREGRVTCRQFNVNDLRIRSGIENLPVGQYLSEALRLALNRYEQAASLLQNKQKRVVLIIDRSLPRYDCDAGGRSTYHYLRFFQKQNFDVMFLPDDFTAHEPYAGELEEAGVVLLCGDRFEMGWQAFFERYGKCIDVVFLNRPDVAIKYIDVLKRESSATLLYYGHDLHYLRLLREYEITGKEVYLEQSEMFREWEYRLWDAVDAVYYPSDEEIKIVASYNESINAKAIPLFLYDISSLNDGGESSCFEERNGILFVGGFAHAPNRDAMLWFCKQVMPGIIKRHPQFVLHIIGGSVPDDIKCLASKNIIFHGWVSEKALVEFYKKTRIVVVPLRFGAGVKGKIVEALRWRSVVLTTPVGAEGFPEMGDALTVAEPDGGFADAVLRLYNDVSRLDQQSEKGYSYFKQYFSFECAAKVLDGDI